VIRQSRKMLDWRPEQQESVCELCESLLNRMHEACQLTPKPKLAEILWSRVGTKQWYSRLQQACYRFHPVAYPIEAADSPVVLAARRPAPVE
jgi:hypothetical protein